ncbi:5-hydroxytryptamine receptor 2C-like [Clytia hemisphaerica]|uniref:5-hydroxytryptamine receptor 2C-like n=1 Tax=Clytia hemisphaerica TaxID=252671 RepID=UPI0034D6DA60
MSKVNTLTTDVEMSRHYYTSEAGSIVLILISCLCLAMNIFEIIYIKRKKKKNSYETLLLSLSISDALFGFANIALPLLNMTHQLLYTYIVRYAYLLSLLLSTVHLTALAMDRYVAISFPLKHRVYWKIKHAKFFLFILWLLSTLTTYLIYPYQKAYDSNDQILWSRMKKTVSSTLTTAEILLAVLYTLVYMQIIKQNRRMSQISNSNQHGSDYSMEEQTSKKKD